MAAGLPGQARPPDEQERVLGLHRFYNGPGRFRPHPSKGVRGNAEGGHKLNRAEWTVCGRKLRVLCPGEGRWYLAAPVRHLQPTAREKWSPALKDEFS